MLTLLENVMSSLPVPFNMIVIVVAFGCVTSVVVSIATQIRIFFCHQQDLAFKRDMVERGMALHDIEQLARATPPQHANRAF